MVKKFSRRAFSLRSVFGLGAAVTYPVAMEVAAIAAPPEIREVVKHVEGGLPRGVNMHYWTSKQPAEPLLYNDGTEIPESMYLVTPYLNGWTVELRCYQ